VKQGAVAGAYLKPSSGRGMKPIHSIPNSIAETYGKGKEGL